MAEPRGQAAVTLRGCVGGERKATSSGTARAIGRSMASGPAARRTSRQGTGHTILFSTNSGGPVPPLQILTDDNPSAPRAGGVS